MPTTHRLRREQLVRRSLADTFAFFADAENLGRITPPWLDFHIETPLPIEMRLGARIAYRLRLHGVRLHWVSEIEIWEPPRRFTDRQLEGPYASWLHAHEFRAVEGGTEVTDSVEYALPLGPIGALANALLVRASLARIFDFRRETVARLLGPRA